MVSRAVQRVLIIFLLLTSAIILYHHSHVRNLKLDIIRHHPLVPDFVNLLLMSSTILLAFLLQILIMKYNVGTNYCAPVFIAGFLLGIVCSHSAIMNLVCKASYFPVAELLTVYFPIVLFNVSFSLDVFLLVKTLPQILVIGSFVFLCTAFFFGVMVVLFLENIQVASFGFVFGILCAPVYPNSITYLLKHHSTRTRQISVLLEGEALFTLVIADIATKLYLSIHTQLVNHWYQFLSVILIRFLLIGLLTGYLFGVLSRYMLKKLYANRLSVFLLFFAMPLLTYNVSETYISGCGSVSVVVLGAMLALERTVLTREAERELVEYWDVAGFILDALVCFTNAIKAGNLILPHIDLSDYVTVFGIYLVYYLVRFLSFLLFAPVVSRLGYGMGFKIMLLCVWCGIKSPLTLEIVRTLKIPLDNEDLFPRVYFYVLGLYVISIFINGTFTYTIMDFLGFTRISTARQMNMNNCMKHLFWKRERNVAVLKMDRFLADCNWRFVLKATNIKHPYEIDMDDQEEYSFVHGYRFTYCNECKKDVPLEPTPIEFKEMTKEAKMRILKTKKMSYFRQYANGMMSKDAIRIMSHAVDLAMDSEKVEINVQDLYAKFTEQSRIQRFIRSRAEALRRMSPTIRPPVTYWRRLCYHLVVPGKRFHKFMLLMIFLDVCFMGLDLFSFLYEKYLGYEMTHFTLILIRAVFTIIYIFEFMVKIMAYTWKYYCRHGFRTYFRSFWNIMDVAVIIIDAAVVTDGIIRYTTGWVIDRKLRHVLQNAALLRAVRLLQFFEIFYPDIIKYLDKSVDDRMAFTYELGKGYATAEAEVLNMLPVMIDNKRIREKEQRKMETDRVYITKLLGLVQKERPWIAITVKTKQAIQTILNAQSEALDALRISGWVDLFEYDKLSASMNDLYKRLNAIDKVQPSAPKVIFKEVAWMADDDEVIDFLFENVTAKKFEPGEVIFEEGKVADGIYIVVTGLFMVSYTPNEHILQALQDYGRLPVADYICKYNEPALDYIVSGNCIGEMSILTRRAYNSTVTADSHSQVYVLSRGVLHRAMELSPDPVTGLACRIWKEVGVRLAIPLLLATPTYQTLSQNQVKFALERAFVPDLQQFKIFVVTDLIEDIVLIEGAVSDFNTKELFKAPCHIPRTVQKIILPTSSLFTLYILIDTKLLIIPAKDVDEYDVMFVAEETCELVRVISPTKCLQHLAQKRLKHRRKTQLIRTPLDRIRKVQSHTVMNVERDMGEHSGYTYFNTQKSEVTSFYIPAEGPERKNT